MKFNFIFIFLFISNSFIGQEKITSKEIDSLSIFLKEYSSTKDKKIPLKAFNFAEESNNDSIIKKNLISFGLESYYLDDLNNLLLSEKKLLEFFIKTNDSLALAKHYYYKALFFKTKEKSDSCFYYFNKSKDIFQSQKDSLAVAKRYLSMAIIQAQEKDYLGSESSTINGLRFIEPLKELKFTSYLYDNLGDMMIYTGRFKEARNSYLNFLKLQLNKSDEDTSLIYARYYNEIAKSYEAETNYLKAREFFKKALSIDSLEIKSNLRYTISLEGFSYNSFKLGDKKTALNGYLKVLSIRKKTNKNRSLVYSHSLLGEFYNSESKKDKANYHTKKALELSKKYNNTERILENLVLLSKLEKGEKGRKYLQEYLILSDSLLKRERLIKNQFAKVRYETEKKDIENTFLKSENEKKQLQLQKEKQQKIIGWLFAFSSLLFISFGVVFIKNRNKKILFAAKLKQVEARENERQQIAKSLHDEVAGDIRILHKKLLHKNLIKESSALEIVKENVRNLSHQLSSVSFNEVSFKNQIINLISDYFDSDFFIRVSGINDINWQKVDNSIKRTLFLCIREAVQNIEKYAEAKKVNLSFKEIKDILYLIISDDGKGFDLEEKKPGIGIKNMKERIIELNGGFKIESSYNKGTIIYLEISKDGKKSKNFNS